MDEARSWYRLAAQHGYAPAQVILGNMYFRGDGVPVDHLEASNWYKQAAEQGDVVAQFLIASIYTTGQGVPQDLVKAYMWLSVAATADHPDARQNSEQGKQVIAGRMTPGQIAEAEKQAQEWLSKKANSEQ
jgi:TPR repeat protein